MAKVMELIFKIGFTVMAIAIVVSAAGALGESESVLFAAMMAFAVGAVMCLSFAVASVWRNY